MAFRDGEPTATVEAGVSCALTEESEGHSTFTRVLVPQETGRNLLLLFKHIVNPSDTMAAFQPVSAEVSDEISREQIDKAFAECPCKDPANAGQDIGRTGCLALKSLVIE